MLRILIEKEKSNEQAKILGCLLKGIPQKFCALSEDANCILLKIGLPKSIRINRRRRLIRLINTAVEETVEYILTQVTADIAAKCVANVTKLNPNDQKAVEKEAVLQICKSNRSDAKRHVKASWYSRIKRRVLKNMLESSVFAISAFIRFRINDYKEYVCRTVDHISQLKMNELKYFEFISSLQHFVESRACEIDEVVITVNDDSYSLTDSNGNAIDVSKYKNMLDKDIDKEDLLLSILLTMAPKTVTLNADESFMDSDFFASLVNIFGSGLKASYITK
ncbi:MAG: hypothetical protein E7312_06385 [Clostridiales bacterium]|nr:hypothetical protein [Clostridiales bacterium]